MKRAFILSACLLVFLCGCERNAALSGIAETNKIEKIFPDENVVAFDFDADGKVCFLTLGETDGLEGYSFPDEASAIKLSLYAEDGGSPRVLEEENGFAANMCSDGDTVYYPAYVYENGSESIVLFGYSLKTDAKERLHTYRDITLVRKMLLVGDKIFTLALGPAKYGIGETGDDYYNSGEILSCFDLETKTESVVWDTGAVEFGAWGNKLVIYAHDADGYFFVTFDASTSEYSEKLRSHSGMIFTFAMCGEDRYIYSATENAYNNSCVTMGSLTEKGRLDIALGGNEAAWNVKYSDGRICFIDGAPQSETFRRLILADISAALDADLSKFLSLASTQISSLVPGSLGFSIVSEQLDAEELALAILSQDSDRDLFLFNSRDGFSQNVKSKGSFYPLNDADGVGEYLDGCFPFIRDAVTDENGNIWALPVSIRINALCYDSEASERCGLDLSDNTLPDEFISAISKAQSDELTYMINPVYYSSLLLEDYLSRNTTFDTEAFRELAEWIKTRIFQNEAFDLSAGSAAQEAEKRVFAAWEAGKREDIDFEIISDKQEFSLYSKLPSKKLAPVPVFFGNDPAVCTFISVNPSSENLRDALDYISLLAKALRDDEKNLCLSGLSVYGTSGFYSGLKTIADNGSIVFGCPNEVYSEAFYRYIDDDLTLDEFIAEADRKLSAYLNE